MVGKSVPYVKTFSCRSCGGQVEVRAVGFTLTVVCTHCDSIIDANDENVKIIAKAKNKSTPHISIPLGTRGKLFGTLWEAIGFMHREDNDGYSWKEYLLFNPKQGFRWLSEYEGHWNFIKMIKVKPTANFKKATLDNREYLLFANYKSKVLNVAGEFYWQITTDDICHMMEYIHPPYILSKEKDSQEENWSLGEKIDAKIIGQAFKLKDLDTTYGIAPNQINHHKEMADYLTKWGAIFFVIICVIQIKTLASSHGKIVHTEEFIYSSPIKPDRTQSFEIPGDLSNVEVLMNTKLRNSWLEVQAELVNEVESDKTYSFIESAEYYSGMDSDGYWAEGTPNADATLSSIPKGQYHINFESIDSSLGDTSTSGLIDESKTFEITVKRDVQRWSNFWIMFFTLGLFPAYYIWRSHSFETKRWSMSSLKY